MDIGDSKATKLSSFQCRFYLHLGSGVEYVKGPFAILVRMFNTKISGGRVFICWVAMRVTLVLAVEHPGRSFEKWLQDLTPAQFLDHETRRQPQAITSQRTRPNCDISDTICVLNIQYDRVTNPRYMDTWYDFRQHSEYPGRGQ
jgi:hypothetical protein